MINRSLALKIVDHLLLVPGTDSKPGRDLLLLGIPSASFFPRDAGNQSTDLGLMVNWADIAGAIPEEGGKLALVIMLENAIGRAKGTDLSGFLTGDINNVTNAYHGLQRVEHHELGQLHTLDLEDTCRDIYNKLVVCPSGLVGFAVPCDSTKLLVNLAKRLESVWPVGRKVVRHQFRQPSSSYTDSQKFIPEKLVKGDNLFPCRINKEFLHPFWDDLSRCAKKSPEVLENDRIVFLLAVHPPDPTSCAPAHVILLEEPDIQLFHVQEFITKTLEGFRWKEAVLDPWVDHVRISYYRGNKIDFDEIYSFLEESIDQLQDQAFNPQEFRNWLVRS